MAKNILFTALCLAAILLFSFAGIDAQNSRTAAVHNKPAASPVDSIPDSIATTPYLSILKTGYYNSASLLALLPARQAAADTLKLMNDKYIAELQLLQTDYRRKYTDYMNYQGTMPQNIKQRRMSELRSLEDEINVFMKSAQKEMENREQELLQPLYQNISLAVKAVGIENGYKCIFDTATPGLVFIDPQAEDITAKLKSKLNLPE